MFSKNQPPQLHIPFIGYTLWLTVLFLIPAFSTGAQNLPRNPTLQQLAGYQNKQQLNWQQKQLPKSSVTYKFSTNYNPSLSSDVGKEHRLAPVVINYPLPVPVNGNQQRTPAPFLRSFLLQELRQYMQWQKQSWWKDPGKLKGAELLRDFYISNRKS